MFNYIDNKLNKITMYRLVMYYLIAILAYAVVLGNAGYIPYNSFYIVASVAYITFFAWVTNILFSKIFKAPVNMESIYITALILSFIITPMQSIYDTKFLWFAFLAAFLASASKFLFTIKKKHIFNPVVIAVLLAGVLSGQAASWWVGNIYLMPVIIIFGILLLRKISRFELVGSFIGVFIISLLITHQSPDFFSTINFINKTIFYSPILFFAFIMLTEPLTSPVARWQRVIYGTIVGILFNPFIHIGTLYFTPETALIIGNIFAYIVNPKTKLVLRLKKKIKIAFNTYDFIFKKEIPFFFKPGQYMEWTLSHKEIDNRGNRRYFTIASSPTEEDVHIGVRFYPDGSSFKQALVTMRVGDRISASQISGEFVLPKDVNKKLVFLAGGIGITPFQSMIKNLLYKKECRDIVILYSNKSIEDIAYIDTLEKAATLGISTRYILTDTTDIPSNWKGEIEYVDAKMIKKIIPDYMERTFYISGPRAMVAAESNILHRLGLRKKQIKSDFFPGFVEH